MLQLCKQSLLPIYKCITIDYINYIERKQPPQMTNFNHTQIAKAVDKQIEEVLLSGGWTNNAGMASRVGQVHKFIKAQINYLSKETGWESIIDLYNEALEETTYFGRMIAQSDEEAMEKGLKLAEATIKLIIQELEGGCAADLDCVWRQVVQYQLLRLHAFCKEKMGDEGAKMIQVMNNKFSAAVNAELALANAA